MIVRDKQQSEHKVNRVIQYRRRNRNRETIRLCEYRIRERERERNIPVTTSVSSPKKKQEEPPLSPPEKETEPLNRRRHKQNLSNRQSQVKKLIEGIDWKRN